MTSLGRYEILGEIGRGGMAVVYAGLAHGEAGFRKPVVVKRIHPHLTRDERFVRMLIREAKLTVLLDHPNVAQVLELGREGDDYFIVLERVEGADLSRLMAASRKARVRIPPSLAAHVAREVLAALGYAHGVHGSGGERMGLVHRDVSPSNVLVGRDGRVKLTDFGVARAPDVSEPSRGGITGKLSYMSPEQARAEEVDARSDLYSVALVLFELLTARRAIEGAGEMELWKAAREGAEGALDTAELPEGFEPVLRRALHPDPEERFPDARSLRQALAPLADEVEYGRERLSELVGLLAPEGEEEPITRSLEPPATTAGSRTTPMLAETLVTRVGACPVSPPPGLASLEGPGRWRRIAPAAVLLLALLAGGAWLAAWGLGWVASSDVGITPGDDGGGGPGAIREEPPVEIGEPAGVSAPPAEEHEPAPVDRHRPREADPGPGDAISSLDDDGIASAKGAGPAAPVADPEGSGTISVIVDGATGKVHVDAPGWIDGYSHIAGRELPAGTWTVTVVNPDAELDWTGQVTIPPDGHVGVMLRRVDDQWQATLR